MPENEPATMRIGLLSVTLALLSVVPSASRAQTPTQFPSDQAGFQQAFTTFMVDADKKVGTAFLAEVFTPFWTGPYLGAPQRTSLTTVANAMLKKRFKPIPDFQVFFKVAAEFPKRSHAPAEFDAWLKGLEVAAKSSRKDDLTAYIQQTKDLFESRMIYDGAGSIWHVGPEPFVFRYDSLLRIHFEKTDLVWASRTDSSIVEGTRGDYSPKYHMWNGHGGRISWRRTGLDPKTNFVQWDHPYALDLKTAELRVDSVLLNDPYFENRLLGTVVDKLRANVNEKNASYPRFEGYDLRKRIDNIMPGIDFEGGFTLQGPNLQGYGTKEQPASLTFEREGKPFILTRGLLYTIEPGKISSEDVSVSVYLDKDSISHPSVSLRFITDKKQLALIKRDEGLSKGPFYDTYHNLDMYFEELRWKQGDPVVQIGNLQGTTQTRTSFESFNYFEMKRYTAMLGIDAVHPLSRLREFSKFAGEKFDAKDFARYTKLQMSQIVPMLIDMANKGYIAYEIEDEMVTLKPRLLEHIMASAGKIDYDVLQFNSNSEDGVNGTINLLNNDLAIKGVSRIILSDSQDVKIFPAEKLVTVKKDRDFSFGGMVKAGKLSFYGKEYYFHYKLYSIDLLNVDSVGFIADSFEPDDEGKYRLVKVKNVLESVTGTLEVDAPSNKSGLKQKDFPAFPKFNSTKESYVFYDRANIQKGAYLRDKFYYKSDPFQLDSLDNFTNEGLRFDGTLSSAGIFPDIRETLRLQPDYALGFVRPTGDGGLPLYGKKAKFAHTLALDNKGLHGDGDLTYLTTIASSKELIFTPDTTFGLADTLYNGAASSPTLNVPNVQASKVQLRLEPAKDVLMAATTAVPMTMYDKAAYLYGKTELTPKGMSGAGMVDFTNATLSSKLFDFKTMKVHADTSDFRLTEGDTASIAFRTDDVNATIKLDERVGEFVSNGTETKVEFPYNQYICYMDRFKWYMDNGDLEMQSDRTAAAGNEDLQLAGSNFISTRPDQDSLSFMAPKARYDLKRHIITANEVQYIKVADALIAPDSLRVRIGRNAKMDPLVNAVVTANFVNKYHVVHDAKVEITSKRKYTASGIYDYVDGTGKTFPIPMPEVGVDSSAQTYARGKVPQDQGFQLSPAFDYFGDVLIKASVKELTFSGNTRILHDCPGLNRNWMAFTGQVDPKDVFIPVSDSLVDAEGFPMGAGIFLTREDPFKVYGTFLSRTRDKLDKPIINAKGLLYYDDVNKAYLISNKDKIRQRDLPGDLVGLSTTSCVITADGHIRTGTDLGQVHADAYGTMDFRGDSASAKAKTTLVIDFPFLGNALEKMTTDILAYPEQKQVDVSKTPYERALREILGKDRSDKLISELSIKGEIKKLPDELEKALVLCDVDLVWNAEDEAWQSKGPIGLGTVLKKPVFRYVKGKVEFQRKRSGDAMTVFLMADDQTWWFFQYTRNYLYAYSSNAEFNTMIGDLKEDKRKFDGKKDEADYQFILTNKRKVDDFRDRFGL